MISDDFSHVDEWGPEKIVTVADPRSGMRGVLVIDNTARGMGKGGTRMGPGLTVTEVMRLARVMTWKWAAVDLGFGGAKAGIRFDPSSSDKELVLRRFVRAGERGARRVRLRPGHGAHGARRRDHAGRAARPRRGRGHTA